MRVSASYLQYALDKFKDDPKSFETSFKNYKMELLDIPSDITEDGTTLAEWCKQYGEDPVETITMLKETYGEEKMECSPKEAREYEITFGKYKGKTLLEVAKEDAQYVCWIASTGSPQYFSTWAARALKTEMGLKHGKKRKYNN